MIEIFDQRWGRLAAIGALVAALGLSACGRKGGLDPPPTAAVPAQAVQDPAATPDPVAAPAQGTLGPDFLLPGAQQSTQQPGLGRGSSAPAAPPPSGRNNQPFFLDWLVN